MGAVKGLLTTLEAATNENANEWQETILVRNSRGYNVGTTLFGLMARLDNEPAENLEYNWFERDPVLKTVVLRAAITTAGTTLGFDDGAVTGTANVNTFLLPGTILMDDTAREFVKVVSNTATNCVVVRGISGSIVAMTATTKFTIVTLGKQEGTTSVAAMYENPVTQTNYIQTFNSAVELSNAFKGSVLRTDMDGALTDRRIQALERICRDIEFSYFLGIKKKFSTADAGAGHTDVTAGYQYYTGGIYDALVQANLSSTNLKTFTAAATITQFSDWLGTCLPYGSDTKLAFCGPSAYSALSKYTNTGTAGYRIMQNETVFGMNIQVVNTPYGELSLTQHPMFREASGLQSWMVVVDLPLLAQKTFEKLFLEPNIQANGSDSYLEQYRAKLGLKLKFPQAFAVGTNLTALSA